MTLFEVLPLFKKYFNLKEVVSEQVYKRYGETAWSFFDPRLLEVVIWVREGIGISLICNTWSNKNAGKVFSERGFRANMDSEVLKKTNLGKLYCTAHGRGQGIDFHAAGGKMTANEIRQWIREHIDECPHPIRLEDDKSAPTWVHIDVCNITENKLVEFSV